MPTPTGTDVDAAVRAFRDGDPILVHDADDREGEVDLCYPARVVQHRDIARLRNDAGGLICVAISGAVADAFDLPFRHEAIDHPITEHEPAYDARPSFSLSVNHRETHTGVTDRDRARTIRELAMAATDPDGYSFASSFRAPGHVNVLRAADGLLASRQGHTELGIALARMAGVPPAVVVCEMLDDETGDALAPADARLYAADEGLVYLESDAVRTSVAAMAEAGPQRT